MVSKARRAGEVEDRFPITDSHGRKRDDEQRVGGAGRGQLLRPGAGVLRDEMHRGADARHLDAGVAGEAVALDEGRRPRRVRPRRGDRRRC